MEIDARYIGDCEGHHIYKSSESIDSRCQKGVKTFMAAACCSQNLVILFPEFWELSKETMTCVLMHEFGHLLGYASEEGADEYAISRTSPEAYKLAIEETRLLQKRYHLRKERHSIM